MEQPNDIKELLRRSEGGDPEALEQLFAPHRPRLLRMVQLRIDDRLRNRIDASDVVQEVHLEAAQRLDKYRQNPALPFHLWLRFLARQRLMLLHRHHIGAQLRDPRREVRLDNAAPEVTVSGMIHRLMGDVTTPTQAMVRNETRKRVQDALDRMHPLDREVLVLRHFEQLGNADAARELGIEESAASKRYLRALERFKKAMGDEKDGESSAV